MNDDTYLFHQTPKELAKDLIPYLPLTPTDILFEPFRGEGAFYEAFPETNPKLWCELQEGKDYTDIPSGFDWVITNPPFKLDTQEKRVNAFWYLLDYFTQRATKGVAFLANDSCFCTLTPKRIKVLHDRGFTLTKVVVCSVKKWRGRYFFLIFTKADPSYMHFLLPNYE